ncbi:MAG: glycosyltransferase [Steroidobacteraceae bacterium]
MRILMVSDVYFPRVNGVSTSIQTYRSDLQALGHRCVLVVPEYPGAAPDSDPDIVRIPSRGVPLDPEDRLFVGRRLKEWGARLQPGDFDVVHIQTPFAAHYAGVKFAKRLGVPVVETYHTYFEHYLHHYMPFVPASWLKALARRWTVSQCHQVDAVISPSRPMADALKAYGVNTPIEVLPTGLPASCFVEGNGDVFRARLGESAKRPLALFVGRVAHEKNIDFLVDMLGELRRQIADVLLVIAGEGPAESHLRSLVAARGLNDNVRFIGYLDRRTTLLDCYRSADAFVFASRTETQGLVLLEAMAQGTPVVSTAVMGTADVLAGTTGSLVMPEDAAIFASGVARVLTDKALRAELSSGAKRDALKWSSRTLAERMARVYQGLVVVSEPAAAEARAL